MNLFGTEWKDHLKDAGLFQMVRTHGKWGCGNMVSPCAAEFCTVLVSVIFTGNNAHGEKLQLFLACNRRLGNFGEICSS